MKMKIEKMMQTQSSTFYNIAHPFSAYCYGQYLTAWTGVGLLSQFQGCYCVTCRTGKHDNMMNLKDASSFYGAWTGVGPGSHLPGCIASSVALTDLEIKTKKMMSYLTMAIDMKKKKNAKMKKMRSYIIMALVGVKKTIEAMSGSYDIDQNQLCLRCVDWSGVTIPFSRSLL